MIKKNTRLRSVAAFAVVFAAMLFFAVPALAASSSSSGSSSANCDSAANKKWKDEAECKQAKGQWVNNDCYYVPVPINIGVSIGGLTQATLSTYLAAAFNLGIGIAAILAVIFIMVGGFRYIAAAGGGEVEQGKGMIKNAIIGLVLTLLSYTLLQTINPAILSLRLPPIKMVKQQVCTSSGGFQDTMIGNPCFTPRDDAECAQACVKRGLTDAVCKCVVVPDSTIETLAKWATLYTPVKELGTKLAQIGVAGMSGAYGLVSCLVKKDDPTLAECTKNDAYMSAYASYKMSTADPTNKEGICLPLAVHTIPIGGICSPGQDTGCVLNAEGKDSKCVQISEGIGMCVSGDANSGCTTSGNECSNGLTCCPLTHGDSIGTCQKTCTGREDGNTCVTGADCDGGYCATVPSHSGSTKQADSKICTSGDIGDLCAFPSDCDGTVAYCPFPLYNCTGTCPSLTKCRDWLRVGAVCCNSGECGAGHTCVGAHPSGGKCAASEDVCDSGSCGTCQ